MPGAAHSTATLRSTTTAFSPPMLERSSASLPPYSLTRSATIARPSPVPGLVSSSRLPRFSASRALSSGMPGPSSSIGIENMRRSPSARQRSRATPQRGCAPISWRFPADCRRSPPDPRARRQRRPRLAGGSKRDAGPRIQLCHHPHHALQQRRHRRAIDDAVALRGDAGALQIVFDLLLHGATPGPRSACPLSPPSARASLSITASGVFSECARLPTWVRDRSTMRRLFSISALVSLASGSISVGNRPPSRCAVPSRTFASASRTRPQRPQAEQDGCGVDRDHADAEQRQVGEQPPFESVDLAFKLRPGCP